MSAGKNLNFTIGMIWEHLNKKSFGIQEILFDKTLIFLQKKQPKPNRQFLIRNLTVI